MTKSPPNQIRDFRALEMIHRFPSSSQGFVDAHRILSDLIPDTTTKQCWITDKVNDGYLIKMEGSNLVRLSRLGKDIVSDGQAKRDDTSTFRKEMRTRLLSWANSRSTGKKDMHDVDPATDDFWYYGRVVSLADIARAARYLKRYKLVTLSSDRSANSDEILDVAVGITAKGEECCDENNGDIEAYLKDKNEMSRTSGPTFNIASAVGSNIVLGDKNSVTSTVPQLETRQQSPIAEKRHKPAPTLGESSLTRKTTDGLIKSTDYYMSTPAKISSFHEHDLGRDASPSKGDMLAFRKAVRECLLRWSYNNSKGEDDHVRVDLEDQKYWNVGRDVSLKDLVRASKELADKNLLWQKTLGSAWEEVLVLLVGITQSGQECVEDYDADIDQYLEVKGIEK